MEDNKKNPLRLEGVGATAVWWIGEFLPDSLLYHKAFGIITIMFPAIFLDRDGVIIENLSTYVRSWEDVHFIPNSLAALKRAQSSPYKFVIITNQSAVGRGILPLELAWEINGGVVQAIQRAGGRVDGSFMCPHAPHEDCDCRKPKPGLIYQAASELKLDLSQSILIGDALSDLLAGQAAGIPKTILLRTGRGRGQEKLPSPATLKPFLVYHDLAEALQSELDANPD
jgi:D-glycero-D-manno-heptose 1,7-bisphosphate phosphatase